MKMRQYLVKNIYNRLKHIINILLMYWGKPDGSIDFCEENYKESVYIAEYWNTISAFVYFIIGYVWIFSRYKKVAMSFMFLSIGTAIWHGTLRYWGQWMDEVGMLIL